MSVSVSPIKSVSLRPGGLLPRSMAGTSHRMRRRDAAGLVAVETCNLQATAGTNESCSPSPIFAVCNSEIRLLPLQKGGGMGCRYVRRLVIAGDVCIYIHNVVVDVCRMEYTLIDTKLSMAPRVTLSGTGTHSGL